jgi:hypothetical protein
MQNIVAKILERSAMLIKIADFPYKYVENDF